MCHQQLDIERRICERLGPHPHITKLVAASKDRCIIVLERLRCSLRYHLIELRKSDHRPPPADVLKWARQTAQALQHVHSYQVKQVDIGAYNVLLDWDGNAKLADFAGSSLDDSAPMVLPGAHATHPLLDPEKPTIFSELFAFGSMLYEMETTNEPYPEKEDSELERLSGADLYPDTSELTLGTVIWNRCMRKYKDASELLLDLQHIIWEGATGIISSEAAGPCMV